MFMFIGKLRPVPSGVLPLKLSIKATLTHPSKHYLLGLTINIEDINHNLNSMHACISTPLLHVRT